MTSYRVSIKVPKKASDKYKQDKFKMARQLASRNFYDFLLESRLPTLVDIRETIQPLTFEIDEIRIDLIVKMVRHEQINVLDTPALERSLARLYPAWYKRLWSIIKNVFSSSQKDRAS